MIIVGAGLSGLIAAHAWPQASVTESAAEPRAGHSALLRFRTDAVAKLVGIEFRPVEVRKGIWYDGDYVLPSIRMANLYSRKVLGDRLSDRSIWSLETVTRWVAPESLYAELVESVGRRISWGVNFDWADYSAHKGGYAAISTAPIGAPLSALFAPAECPTLERAPILVERFRVPRAHVHQTVYFPTPEHSVYRASITGDLLIVEHAGTDTYGDWRDEVWEALALETADELEVAQQSFGKIQPLEDAVRKNLLFRLTHEHGIFSLGRFATWRNILLDDVVDDIAVIKRLLKIEAGAGAYQARLATV